MQMDRPTMPPSNSGDTYAGYWAIAAMLAAVAAFALIVTGIAYALSVAGLDPAPGETKTDKPQSQQCEMPRR